MNEQIQSLLFHSKLWLTIYLIARISVARHQWKLSDALVREKCASAIFKRVSIAGK